MPHTHSGVRAFELEGLPGYTAHSQFPNSPLLKESFHDQSHCHPPSLLSRPLPFPSSTSDYLTCPMYFSVDGLSATLKMSSPGRKVLSPYPTPCPSPAQRSGLHSAGRCSVPSRLQHRGQACTQQMGSRCIINTEETDTQAAEHRASRRVSWGQTRRNAPS